MKTLLAIYLICFCNTLMAQISASVGPGRNQPALNRIHRYHSHPITPLLYEDFEAQPGYDIAGWATDVIAPGTINPDNTTNVLYGTQSLAIDESNDDQSMVTNSFTASDHVWVSFLFKPMNVPDSADTGVFYLRASDNSCQLKFSLNSDQEARIQFQCGGLAHQLGAPISAGNTYYVWIEYWNDNGANAYASLAMSTSPLRPTSGSQFVEATGTSTSTQVSRVMIGRPSSENGSEIDFIMDHLLVDDQLIGNYP